MSAPKEQPGSGARPTAIPEHTRSQEPNKYLLADTSKKPVPQQKGQAPVSYLPHAPIDLAFSEHSGSSLKTPAWPDPASWLCQTHSNCRARLLLSLHLSSHL